MAEQIALEEIKIEFDLHFREGLNLDAVSRYADVWNLLPPIKCVRLEDGTLLLASGLHRYHGYQEAGEATIPTEITDGTHRDAMVIGLKDNALHGLPLSRDERNRAIAQLAKEGMSYPAIGEIFSLGDNMVGKIAKAHGIERRPKEVNQKGQRTREDAANNRNNYGSDSDMDPNNYAKKATAEPKCEQTDPEIQEMQVNGTAVEAGSTPEDASPADPSPMAGLRVNLSEPFTIELLPGQWIGLVNAAEGNPDLAQDELAVAAAQIVKDRFANFGIPWKRGDDAAPDNGDSCLSSADMSATEDIGLAYPAHTADQDA